MAASQNGHVEVVNMLLQHGARVDLQKEVYTCFFVNYPIYYHPIFLSLYLKFITMSRICECAHKMQLI